MTPLTPTDIIADELTRAPIYVSARTILNALAEQDYHVVKREPCTIVFRDGEMRAM